MKIVIVQFSAILKNPNVVEVAQTIVLMSLQNETTGFVLHFFPVRSSSKLDKEMKTFYMVLQHFFFPMHALYCFLS